MKQNNPKKLKLPKNYIILYNGAIVNIKRFHNESVFFDGKEETEKCLIELLEKNNN